MDIVEWRPLFTACTKRSEDLWGQNVTIVQNDPIIFRVKEKNAQKGFNPPIWTILRRTRETARSDFFFAWYSAPIYHHLLVFLARLCRLQTLSKWLFQILVALFLFQLQKAYFPRSKFHTPFPTLRFPSFSSFLIWFLLRKDYFCYSSFPHRILKRDDFSWFFPHWILWRDDFFRFLPHLLI